MTLPRHPATMQMLRWFDYGHLPERLQVISKPMHKLAYDLVDQLDDGPELTTGLRKLLEAKDCFVRAALPPIPPTTEFPASR